MWQPVSEPRLFLMKAAAAKKEGKRLSGQDRAGNFVLAVLSNAFNR
jgi:hypothetical protein